jgi:hypothetical protein
MKAKKLSKGKKKRIDPRKQFVSFVSVLNGFWKDIKEVMRSKEAFIGLGAVVLALLIVAGSYILITRTGGSDDTPLAIEEIISSYYHPLTGEPLEEELSELPGIYGVMIENAADAWPLSGLNESFLLVEAPVEGNIPRFLAFYTEDTSVEKIGPVRSARPYYIDFALPFDALYAHVGGSPEALNRLNAGNLRDLDEFFYGSFFYRDTGSQRFAPHNVYTNSRLLDAAAKQFDMRQGALGAELPFGEMTPLGAPFSIEIDWTSGTTYDVTWVYEVDSEQFRREQGPGYELLEGGDDVMASSILLIEADVRTIDDVGRKAIDLLGNGRGIAITPEGEAQITWSKSSASEPMTFMREDGEQLTLAGGTVWMQILPSLDRVTVLR